MASSTRLAAASLPTAGGAAGVGVPSLRVLELYLGAPLMLAEKKATMVVEDGWWVALLLRGTESSRDLLDVDGVEVKQGLDGDSHLG